MRGILAERSIAALCHSRIDQLDGSVRDGVSYDRLQPAALVNEAAGSNGGRVATSKLSGEVAAQT